VVGRVCRRIGLAEFDDLMAWRRVGDRPLHAPGPRWYRTMDEDPRFSETWRDPFCHPDAQGEERRRRFGDYTTRVVAGDGPTVRG
jgi:hypothetical protein